MKKTLTPIVCLLLGLLTAACFWPISKHGFIGLDDPKYLVQNANVRAGVTWSGLSWAFTTGYASNWHPITWLSHMLDCQLYAMAPGAHHLTNLLFHTANALLVFFLLTRLTGASWRSALVAGLFAWHPTHVESVAWAAERKDVLSTFFFLLTLAAYVRYVKGSRNLPSVADRQATPGQSPECATYLDPVKSGAEFAVNNRQSTFKISTAGYYWLAVFLFVLGLMSKPMLVTLPFVLLLLDYWPLRRLSLPSLQGSGNPLTYQSINPTIHQSIVALLRLVGEKLPFFVLSVVVSLVTYLVQKAGGAVSSLETVSLGARIANAVVAYVRYLSKTIWPSDLAVFYPQPDQWPFLVVVGCGMLLVCLSWLVLRGSSRYPYLAVGWFWFVGTLVPTIGLVQVGSQSMADRYLYIPSLGLFLVAAWGGYDLLGRQRRAGGILTTDFADTTDSVSDIRGIREIRGQTVTGVAHPRTCVLIGGVSAILIACLGATAIQVAYWQDDETLFGHAMRVTSDNYLAYDHLAKVCEKSGRNEEATAYYTKLLELKPRYPEGQYNLGTLLMGMGRLNEAEPHLKAAVALRPLWAEAQSNLGLALFRRNKLNEALSHLEAATRLRPRDPDQFTNLGVALLGMNRVEEAAKSFSSALALKPDSPQARLLFALALSRGHKCDEARAEARRANELALASGQSDVAAKSRELMKSCVTGE